jgi:DNA replication protein DnaC
MQKVNMLDLFGVKRMTDLFFLRFPGLKGKVNVEVVKLECAKCNAPYVFEYRYVLDGEPKILRDSNICSNCANRNFEKQVNQEIQEMRQQSVLNKWYHIKDNDPCGFKNYEITTKATQEAKDKAINYTKMIISGKLDANLLLMGSTGTGKSHLAKTVCKTAKEKGLKVAYIEAVELFELIKATFGHTRHNEMLFNEYASFDLVCIDDVGLETKKTGEVSWSVAEWTKIINAREGKATIYTTNFDDLALADVIGQRAFSRMYMDTVFIDLFTDDYRKKLKR